MPIEWNVISESQAGFLKGRFIGETTRIIYDVLDYCKTNNIPGLLLTIDFEKAFDTIDWDFIDKTLQSFNFGQSLRKWVKLFFNDSSSPNLNFGYLSDFFKCWLKNWFKWKTLRTYTTTLVKRTI